MAYKVKTRKLMVFTMTGDYSGFSDGRDWFKVVISYCF